MVCLDSTEAPPTDDGAPSRRKGSKLRTPVSYSEALGRNTPLDDPDDTKTDGGLTLDTHIPTPTGWTSVAEVQVGDRVIGEKGQPVLVSAKSNILSHPCFELVLSDGTRVLSDGNQRWLIDLRGELCRVATTAELDRFKGDLMPSGLKKYLRISNVQPIDFLLSAVLPIEPYIFGAWLGDGTAKSGEIAVGWQDYDEMMLELSSRWDGDLEPYKSEGKATMVKLRSLRPTSCKGSHDPASFIMHYGFWRCPECRGNPLASLGVAPLDHEDGLCRYNHPGSKGDNKVCRVCWTARYGWFQLESDTEPLIDLLKNNGLHKNKMIPETYLRGSRDQRLLLLQGLMDTDGHWNPLRKRAVFINTNENLAQGVAELARSFGVTVQWFLAPAVNARSKRSFMVEFKPVGFNPFSLPRKARPVAEFHLDPVPTRALALWRYVRSIERITSIPTQGIAVDSHENLFLVGRSYVVAQGLRGH